MYKPKLLPEIELGKKEKQTVAPNIQNTVAPPQPMEMQESPKTSLESLNAVSMLYKLRKKIMRVAKNKDSMDKVKLMLEESKVKNPAAIEMLLSTQLSNNIVEYFLSLTDNNPVKAKSLAKKFNFKV